MTLVFALGALICCGVAGYFAWKANSVEGGFGNADPMTLDLLAAAARFNRAATIFTLFAVALAALAALSR